MPVELAHGTLGQMLLRRRDVVALGQVLDDLFPQPASREELSLRIGEPPLQIGHGATIGRLCAKVPRVLFINGIICSTWRDQRMLARLSACKSEYQISSAAEKGDAPRRGPPLPSPSLGCPSEKSTALLTKAGPGRAVTAVAKSNARVRVCMVSEQKRRWKMGD